jgi:hypothetical protein
MRPEHLALIRLALSRERLRQALCDAAAPSHESAPQSAAARSIAGAPSAGSLTVLLIDVVRSVWATRPLRHAADAVAEVARCALRPTARRHPLGLMLGALLMGGLLVWARPWRWLLKPALAAAWMPQLLVWTLTQMPIQSWTSALASPAQPPRTPAQAPASSPS